MICLRAAGTDFESPIESDGTVREGERVNERATYGTSRQRNAWHWHGMADIQGPRVY